MKKKCKQKVSEIEREKNQLILQNIKIVVKEKTIFIIDLTSVFKSMK